MNGLRIGLLGSGEFEEWAGEVDRWLLERAGAGDGRVLVLPTACAPEGDDVFERWAAMARRHYDRLGIPAEVLPLKTRSDAENPALAAKLESASLVFASGGNPAYLVRTLAGTRFWQALREGLDRGVGYAGCSAGAMCLGQVAPDTAIRGRNPERWKQALGLFPDVVIGAHWDRIERYRPGARDFFVESVPLGARLLALDERTAVVGNGTQWQVLGTGSAHLLDGGVWRSFALGETFAAALPAGAQ